MSKIEAIQKKIELWSVYLAGLIIIILMLIITTESLLRKFVGYSIPGIFEISAQLMVGVSLLGIAYVQDEKEHISVDIMNTILPQTMIKLTDILIGMMGFFITAIFAYQGVLKFIESFTLGETTMGIVSVPFWPGRLIIVLAMTLICIRFLFDLIHLLTNKKQLDLVKNEEDIKK